jgi:hypothetical protein
MKGVIQFANERPYGPKTLRSFKLKGDKVLYKLPDLEAMPAVVKVGTEVEFEFAMCQDGTSANVDIKSLKAAVHVPASPAAPVSAGGSGSTDWAAKDASIQYQSSRAHAIQFITLLIEREVVKLPAKVADKLKTVESMLDLYTSQFYQDIATKGAVARVLEAETGTSEPAGEPKSEEDDE